MKRIIYDNDGALAIVVPAPSWTGTIEELAKRVVPKGVGFEIVDESQISTNRTFRDAWIKGETGIEIDMGKAKEIAHEKRRAKRQKEITPLDIEATIPTMGKLAEMKRQKIRESNADLQTEIDGAQDEEALTSIAEKNNL